MSEDGAREGPVVLDEDLATGLPSALDLVAARRVLVLAPPSRRFVAEVCAALGGRPFELSALARVHVPEELATEAAEALTRFSADTIVAVGGGSAIGLGKALRLRHEVGFIAIPSTYSGSERTNIYGLTSGGEKRSGRDDRVRPDVVLYDVTLTKSLPLRLSVQSLLNALAHPVSALSTGALEGAARAEALATAKAVHLALDELLRAPESSGARRAAFQAASRAGRVIDAHPLGLHHRLAHFVGGAFGLEHAAAHSVILPHSLAAYAASDPRGFAELAAALEVADPAQAVMELLRRSGAESSLAELGVDLAALEARLSERPELPPEVLLRAHRGAA